MTTYRIEGDWLVEVSERKPPTSPNYSVTSGGIDTGSPHQPPGLIEYTNPEWDDYERHLFSLKRLRISPELAAHLGDRMEVGESEIEVREEEGIVYQIGLTTITNGAYNTIQVAYPKLIDGDVWKEVWGDIVDVMYDRSITANAKAVFDILKSKYKLERL